MEILISIVLYVWVRIRLKRLSIDAKRVKDESEK